MNQTKTKHIPVLFDEVLKVLQPEEAQTYLDLTAGYGGHASAVIERIGKKGRATLVDRDQNAINHLADRFGNDDNVQLVHSDFLGASRSLSEAGEHYDMILVDLGVSSPHLDSAERGFSFANEGPLDMRMDNRQAVTAELVVNTWDEQELVRILREYGEVTRAHRIAAAIVEKRPYRTTTQLAEVVAAASPRKKGKGIHPATLVFQAIRIAVNEELEQLRAALPLWIDMLQPGGRLAVISFHSLEDRLVKQAFKEQAGNRYDANLQLLTVRPIEASADELVFNPRARSAKLRAAAKNKK